MISRSYFMVCRKGSEAGKGAYSENSCLVTVKSWLPKTSDAFKEGKASAEKMLSEYPGGEVFCTSFVRV